MHSRRIGLYGTGRAAARVLDEICASRHRLTAAVAYLDAEAGQDIGTLVGGSPAGVRTTTDLEAAIGSEAFDVLVYCGLSGPVLDRAIDACTARGVDLVHANFVHPRVVMPAHRFDELNDRARRTGARIVGTGMLPGFWLDVLPALLTSALPGPVSVEGISRADITSWGPQVLTDELGIGRSPDAQPDAISGMLRQSATMIAEVLRLGSTEATASGGPITATEPFEVAGIDVPRGACIGFERSATVSDSGGERVRVSWTGLPAGYQQFRSSLTIAATGADGTVIRIDTERPADPYPGTAARLIHAAGAVAKLPGGLHTTIALPI
ncbi:hypothetical protein LB823_03630 [Tsukamurella sp. M9C]|uniref:hypothetical protein n=1 Tax=unclassified Tsukamurella TaxID=2633480 RepID=UPI001CCE6487|nr:hypothetical protein [Tsukamurella sp. M9C]MCA0155284.1 hypothetical protein [Tsukamurella sp. M9C]